MGDRSSRLWRTAFMIPRSTMLNECKPDTAGIGDHRPVLYHAAMKRDVRHVSVLLGPVIEALAPRPGQVFVDCTLGLGGHASELLRLVGPGGKVIGIDFDPRNIEIARTRLASVESGG